MGRSVVLGALLLVLVANVSFCQAQKYLKVGDTLQLSPQPISGAITSILWKYDKNLLAEWVKGSIELTYYSKFKGRTTLNTDTGVLEIRGLTAADTGVYSVVINSQVQSQVHNIVVIEDVPQPVVEAKPLSCSSASERCKLVCEGDISKAGPVEYFWKKDDGEWARSGRNTTEIINDEETKRVETFSCRMKNPLSEKESNAKPNPFYQEEKPKKASSLESWMVVLIVFIVIIIIIVVVVVLYFTSEAFKNMVDRCLPCKKSTKAANATTTEVDMNEKEIDPLTAKLDTEQ